MLLNENWDDFIFEIDGITIANVPFLGAREIHDQFEFVISLNDPDSINFIEGRPGVLRIEIEDIEASEEQVSDAMEKVGDFISNSPQSILIHCEGGVSRSPAVTLYFLLKNLTSNEDDAMNLLFKLNPWAMPHALFVKWIATELKMPTLVSKCENARKSCFHKN